MKKLGVLTGTCGKETVRLRPMLIFEEKHSEFEFIMIGQPVLLIFITVPALIAAFDKVLGEL